MSSSLCSDQSYLKKATVREIFLRENSSTHGSQTINILPVPQIRVVFFCSEEYEHRYRRDPMCRRSFFMSNSSIHGSHTNIFCLSSIFFGLLLCSEEDEHILWTTVKEISTEDMSIFSVRLDTLSCLFHCHIPTHSGIKYQTAYR